MSRSGDTPAFDMKPRIVYPMEGGTALVTFEEEAGEVEASGAVQAPLGEASPDVSAASQWPNASWR